MGDLSYNKELPVKVKANDVLLAEVGEERSVHKESLHCLGSVDLLPFFSFIIGVAATSFGSAASLLTTLTSKLSLLLLPAVGPQLLKMSLSPEALAGQDHGLGLPPNPIFLAGFIFLVKTPSAATASPRSMTRST